MTEEYSAFHCESLNKDVLLSLWEGGRRLWTQLRLFVGRCHRAERVPWGWQRPAALILLPTHRRWRGFRGRLQTRAALISHFICGCKAALQKPSASTGRVSAAYLIITELQKTVFQSSADRFSLSRPTDLLEGVGRQQREGLQSSNAQLHLCRFDTQRIHKDKMFSKFMANKVTQSKRGFFFLLFLSCSTRQYRLFQDLIMGQWGREINFRQWRSHGVRLTGTPGPGRWARGQTPWQSLKSPRKG